MRTIRIFTSLVMLPVVVVVSLDRAQAQRGPASTPQQATVVASGIPGAGAIAQIGVFHKGGPFAADLDPKVQRLLERS